MAEARGLETRFRDAVNAAGTGDPVVVGVSGGSDSVALLHLTHECRTIATVVHIDHQLRADSGEDADFVQGMCESLGVDCRIERVDVSAATGSREADAREARHEVFGRVSDEFGGVDVLLGHTRDDQVETVLYRIMRGTGVGGLAGIRVRRGHLVRPMLGLGRDELRGHLKDLGIEWRDDPTNDGDDNDRAWIRNELLPEMRTRRAGVDWAILRLAENALDADEFIRESLATLLAKVRFGPEVVEIPASLIGDNPIVDAELVSAALTHLGGRVEAETIGSALRPLTSDLGNGIVSEHVPGLLRIRRVG